MVVAVGAVVLGAGCDEPEVEQYTVPKGSESIAEVAPADPPRAEPGDAVAGVPPATADAPAPATDDHAGWVVPTGWRELDEPRPMRVTTFVIDDEAGPVEVAVTRFPGDVGGMLANVNRWRGQIGLEPVTAAELDALLTPFESPGFDGHLLHVRGPSQHMLAASLYEPAADRTWFVRVVGAEPVIERVKPEVFAFAQSFGTTRGAEESREPH